MWELGQWQASRDGTGAPPAQPATAVPAMSQAATTMEAPRRSPSPRSNNAVDVVSTRTERGATVHRLKKREAPARRPQPEPTQAPRTEVAVAPPKREKAAPKSKPQKVKATRAPKETPTLELRPGEAVLGTVSGRSHLSRTTLYVTNFRVAQSKLRGRLVWIPHEHIDDLHVTSRGKGIRLQSSIEMISLNGDRDEVASILELIERHMASARRPGARFDADLVQQWCDRSSEMWDSHTGRIRLWIRRHPAVTFSVLGGFLGVVKLFGP